MTIFFFPGTRLVLSDLSTKVSAVTVVMNDTQDFWVDSSMDPQAVDGLPLNLSLNPALDPVLQARPYFITNSKPVGLFRVTKLNFDPIGLNAWHGNFDGCRFIKLQMQLSSDRPVDLFFDMRCTQHSTAPMMSSIKRVLDAVVFIPLAFVNFAIALLTFRFFRKPKAFPKQRVAHAESPEEGKGGRPDSSRAA